MALYRDALPQLGDEVFLSDSGLETILVFHHDVDLPEFASFPLVDDESGVALLREYYASHTLLAQRSGVGIVLETPTWRANGDWGAKLGYDEGALAAVNRAAVELVVEVRGQAGPPVVVSGCIGPRGDAYRPESLMTTDESQAYHRMQVDVLAGTAVDLVTAMTLTYAAEAIGIVRAAEAAGVPVVISFTVETDGLLPDGSSLGSAIVEVDEATGSYASYFMVNCAHPTHFDDVLTRDAPWMQRIRGVRANASRMSHQELDSAPELDDGDPVELGEQYAALRERHPHISVLGGCCGTDLRHVEQIALACVAR